MDNRRGLRQGRTGPHPAEFMLASEYLIRKSGEIRNL